MRPKLRCAAIARGAVLRKGLNRKDYCGFADALESVVLGVEPEAGDAAVGASLEGEGAIGWLGAGAVLAGATVWSGAGT
jgi:hypothetical protein